jgi:hypothetical protein
MSMQETYRLNFQKLVIPGWGVRYGRTWRSAAADRAVDLAELLQMLGDVKGPYLLEELQLALDGGAYEEYYAPNGAQGRCGVQIQPPDVVVNGAYRMPLIRFMGLVAEWVEFVGR